MSGEQKTAEEKRMDRCFEFAQLYADQQNAALKASLAELIPIASKARGVELPGEEFQRAVKAIENAKKLLNKSNDSAQDHSTGSSDQ